jgi:hypothetical protein
MTRVAGGLIAVTLVLGLAACGSDSDSSSGSKDETTTTEKKTTTTSAAKQQTDAEAAAGITAALTNFLGAEGADAKLKTVAGSDSAAFRAVFEQTQAATAGAKLPVKPLNVTATVSGDKAQFQYDLAKADDNAILLAAQKGDAVFEDGTWKITATYVCDLSGQGAPALLQPCLDAAAKA